MIAGNQSDDPMLDVPHHHAVRDAAAKAAPAKNAVTPFATPWLPLDVATLAPMPSLKLRHGHSACTSLPSDSPWALRGPRLL